MNDPRYFARFWSKRLAALGKTQREIGAKFGVSQPAVSRIVNGERYSHVR